MSRKLIGFSSLAAAIALVYGGCGGDTTEPPQQVDPEPTRAVVAAGANQTGTVGQALPAALIVQVNDQTGSGMQGVAVSFVVTQGGGTVSSATATTDADGQASTNWTLGTTAGTNHQVTATVTSATNVTTTFSATATADVPVVMSPDSGDGQNALKGTKVPQMLVVLLRDQYANGVPGQLVQFVTPGGSGSPDSTVAFTDDEGRARTGWTLGTDVGEDTAQAVVSGLTGSPVTFTAVAHDLSIETVTPNPLVLGATGTITGSGFDAVPANNILTIGSETASVTAATPTQLDFDVPSVCVPAGGFDVQVVVGSFTSAPKSANLEPAAFLSMAVGEQVIIEDPTQFCLQFDESAGDESYLVGVQSVTEVASTNTPVMVSSVVAAAGAPAPAAAPPVAVSTRRSQLSPRVVGQLQDLQRRRIAETRILAQSLELMRTMPRGPARAAPAGHIPPDAQVGDQIAIRVPTGSPLTCDAYEEITTEVRHVGTQAIWLEDLANPAGGFTTADFQTFDTQFTNDIYGADVGHFGVPTDIDGNGRVAFVATEQTNIQGPAGFVSPLDFLARADCASSDEGELVYIWAPDPAGEVSDSLSLEWAQFTTATLNAHEFVHVIQVGRRVQAGFPLATLWELEGQASLGEEIVGHLVEGNAVGQDLAADVAFDFPGVAESYWYLFTFDDIMRYYGADYYFAFGTRIPGAPEECTWLARVDDNPCIFTLVNGVPWSLFRWLSDHYGPGFVGGEAGFHQALIDNDLAGFENIETLVGVPIETLMAQWAAMLYIDNRILDDGTAVVADPILTMPSWDLFDIFENTVLDGINVHTLEPRNGGFNDYSADVNVRAASTAYFIVSGDGRSATALGATDQSGMTLPQQMQLWVVRMK
jgi:hypothetical protein